MIISSKGDFPLDFINWFINLNLVQSWLLFGAEILITLTIMSILAYISKDTLDSHFDRFTILYFLIFLIVFVPTILLILYKYDPALFTTVLSICFAIFVVLMASTETRYDRLGRVIYGSGNTSLLSKYWRRRRLRMRRRDALRYAKAFISPYSGIFSKLVLSNKYCKLTFTKEKEFYKFFVIGKEFNSKNTLPFFEAHSIEKTIWVEEFFNSLCFNFSYNTKIENLKNIFNNEKFFVDDSNYDISKKQTLSQKAPQSKEKEIPPVVQMLNVININEATEAEITGLPGINIIMAKKIIKQRDYIGGFNSINEFISFIKVKPHFEKQLRQMVVVKSIKKQSSPKGERILDIDE